MAINHTAGLVRRDRMEVAPENHHYISLTFLNAWMENVARPHAHGVFLDYGCGGQPYRDFFAGSVARYIGADVVASQGVKLDLKIDPDKPLRLPDGSVDTILSTQVLEHVPDFGFYLGECWRLLRPGGALILTVPMQWRHHETPFDYWRFTRYGIVAALEQRGFRVEDASPCGGVFALIGQILLSHLAETGKIKPLLFRLVNRTALWLDGKYADFEDTLNWMCLARKR